MVAGHGTHLPPRKQICDHSGPLSAIAPSIDRFNNIVKDVSSEISLSLFYVISNVFSVIWSRHLKVLRNVVDFEIQKIKGIRVFLDLDNVFGIIFRVAIACFSFSEVNPTCNLL